MSTPIASINVAISRPTLPPTDRLSDFYHWTFYIHNPSTGLHRQYEVEGEANFLSRNILSEPPDSSRLIKTIPVGHISQKSIPLLEAVIEKVEIRNDIFSWDCQDYVIEILDALQEAELLGEMEGYEDVRRHIGLMRGTFEDTKKGLLIYEDYCCGVADGERDDDEEIFHTEDQESLLEPERVCSEELVVESSSEDEDVSNPTFQA